MLEERKKVVGIDPGFDGGLTCLLEGGAVVETMPMPTIQVGKKRKLDTRGICAFIQRNDPSFVIIEQVHSMPKQGVSSTFSFGYGAGVIEGIISALGISYTFVIPQMWMKAVLSGLPKGSGEKSSIIWCQRMFPNVDWKKSEKSRAPHDGMTDSACLAWYALTNRYGLS